MHLPALNQDTIFAALLAATTLYGLVGGSNRVRSLIVSIYVGIVMAETLQSTVAPLTHGIDPNQLELILLGLPVLLFTLPWHNSHAETGSTLLNLLAGLAAGAFLITAGLHVIAPSLSTQVASNSLIATQLGGSYLWFVLAMPLVALAPHFMKSKPKRRHY